MIAPFTILTTDDHLSVASQFGIFWAITVPVTALVLLVWVVWTQRDWIIERLGLERIVAEDDPTTRRPRRRGGTRFIQQEMVPPRPHAS